MKISSRSLWHFILMAVLAVTILGVLALPVYSTAKPEKDGPMKEIQNVPDPLTDPSQLSSAEWKDRLTPEQYQILRQAGTEPAHGKVYDQFMRQDSGTYYCAGCGAELFTSDHKFDSHCGWPSFWDPAKIDSIEKRVDNSLGRQRTEVVCAKCKGHLGHLFEGEGFDTPTDQRYCINGTVLIFVPDKKTDGDSD